MVSANAARLDKLVTDVIRSWESQIISSRLLGVDDWQARDGSAAIIAALSGEADLRQHGKLIILAQGISS